MKGKGNHSLLEPNVFQHLSNESESAPAASIDIS